MTKQGLISNIYKQFIQLNIKKKKPTNSPIEKWAENEQTLFQRGNTDGQQAHGKMLNFANHQENTNQNHNEISPHTCQNGSHQKDQK